MAGTEDEELARIARQEANERVARMLAALREHPEAPWDEVYRQAHTVAGLGDELRDDVAETARRLVGRLRDERGRAVHLTPDEEDAVRRDVAQLSRLVREATSSKLNRS